MSLCTLWTLKQAPAHADPQDCDSKWMYNFVAEKCSSISLKFTKSDSAECHACHWKYAQCAMHGRCQPAFRGLTLQILP